MGPDNDGSRDGRTDRGTEGTSDAVDTRATSRRKLLKQGAAASVAVSIGATVSAGSAGAQDHGETSIARITFRNQPTDGTGIAIESVRLPEGGYVTIHYDGVVQEDVGLADSIIGVSGFLEAGDHRDVEFNMFQIPGIYFETGEIEDDQWLVAVPHRETNGNETYDRILTDGDADGPYTEAGAPVADVAYATIEDVTETT